MSKNDEKKVRRKQKRSQNLINSDSGVNCCDDPTEVNDNNYSFIHSFTNRSFKSILLFFRE